jgi:hypothetical protein
VADRTIEFLLDAKDRASDVFSKVGRSAEGLGTKVGGVLKEFGRGAVLGAGATAFAAISGKFGEAFAGAQEAARGVKILENQISNLGPSGQKAFAQASQFADQLSGSIAQDDDDIKAVLTKLASFPDAFKQGSLGAEGMRRSTEAAFDLQAIGIGDATSNIIGIGKAMNDPIKGMNALSKAGVSFSEQQKVAIKQAIQHGDLAKAQSVLLEGIESNAKGAAAAGVSNMDRLKVRFDNMAEGLAGKLLPYVERFAGFLIAKMPQIEAFIGKVGDAISGVIGIFKGADNGAITKAFGVDPSVISKLTGLRTTATEVFDSVKKYAQQVGQAVGPALRKIGDTIKTDVVPALAAFIKAMAPIVQFLLSVLGPTVSRVFSALGTIISGALKLIAGLLNVFAGILTGDWRRVWSGIQQITSGAWAIIRGLFSAALAALRGSLAGATGAIGAAARGIMNAVTSAFSNAGSALLGAGRRIVDGFIDGIRAGFARVRSTLSSLTSMLPSWKGPARRDSRILFGAGDLVMRGFQRGLESRYSSVRASLGGFSDDLSTTAIPRATLSGSGASVINHFTITQPLGTPEAIARAVAEAQARSGARGYGIGAASGVRVGT